MKCYQGPTCKDDHQRRSDLLAHSSLNGIDYVEVEPTNHRILRVFFLKTLPPGAYGFDGNPAKISITGGTRIVGIQAMAAVRKTTPEHPEGHLEITVDRPGDFSAYTLALHPSTTDELDSFFSSVQFSFMASCPVDFDCRRTGVCPLPEREELPLDYLAKDYASFRRMMLDLLARLNPHFVERNPSDLGIALIELLAYYGDHLSYLQDAVANEAFLDTVRQRISARRHARLVDYRMHDGRNAWTYLHVVASGGQPVTLTAGLPVVTRILAPLIGEMSPPQVVIDKEKLDTTTPDPNAALASAVVFETAHDLGLHADNNEICIHTWGNEECCLLPGATEACLYSVDPGTGVATRPTLEKGDFLLIEEVRSPITGEAADADPAIRQVVRIDEQPSDDHDDLYSDTLTWDGTRRNWVLQARGAAGAPLPLSRVHWRQEDALRFRFRLSVQQSDSGPLRNISVARGNMVLVDHGRTVEEQVEPPAPISGDRPFRLTLSRGPLTMQCQPDRVEYEPTGHLSTDRWDLEGGAEAAKPAISVLAKSPTEELWTPVLHLLDSPPFAEHFVPEVDNDGRAVLRFGDGEYGRHVAGATAFKIIYRLGNGRQGNIGAESLSHLVAPVTLRSAIAGVRNPLPGIGGVDPETIEEVRERAPQAFHAKQYRAVIEADYAAAAREAPDLSGAVASFRWTGSWHTVFVGADPRRPSDLVSDPNGRLGLSPGFRRRVSAFLDRYRLAGYDMEVRAPAFVPLEIELEVCAAPGHFRNDVHQAVAEALSNRVLPDGRRGFFHADNLTFGQSVYLSRIYAAVEAVEGVDSAVVRTFRRYGRADNEELASGVIAIGAWEIAQLENDPNFMERGALRIAVCGGKA